MSVLRDLARTRGKEKKYFRHLTGFSSNEKFRRVLEFVLPGGRRKNITYCSTKASKDHKIDTSLLFDSDQEAPNDGDDYDDDNGSSDDDNGSSALETEIFKRSCSICGRQGFASYDETSFRPDQS